MSRLFRNLASKCSRFLYLLTFYIILMNSTVWANPTPSTASTNPQVRFVTNLGNFTVELYPDKAPISVTNFLRYVDSGFYSGTIFHRVISGFMIQGGGFTANMIKKEPRPPIPLEIDKGLSNLRGTIVMARTSDPNSATSQFFINVVNNRALDKLGGGYAVFGSVIEGMDTVDKIRITPTSRKGEHGDVPVDTVLIKSAQRVYKESIAIVGIKYNLDLESKVLKRSPTYSVPIGLSKEEELSHKLIRSETLEINKSFEAELGAEFELWIDMEVNLRVKLEQMNSTTFTQEDSIVKKAQINGDGNRYRFVYSALYRTGIATVEHRRESRVITKEIPFKYQDGFDITIERVD